MKKSLRVLLISGIAILASLNGISQRYLSDFDSMLFVKDTLRPVLKRFENLRITGYIQPQFQVAQRKGAGSYNGGDFAPQSDNRFMLRRARVKIDYFLATKDNYPVALFTFQVDATERGVGLRDMFVKLYETKKHNFSMTAGMFARPFGYEVNLSSTYREAPERGRMSQILMPSERDLGAMITYEPQRREARNKRIKIDAGIFNGQGLSGRADFDSYKDFISRIAVKPLKSKSWDFSGGLSLLYGGWRNGTKYEYETRSGINGEKYFAVDSTPSNLGGKAPRQYFGADVQALLHHGWGETEFRAEYWTGKQPGIATTTTNPGDTPSLNGIPLPTYKRNFDGAFLLFLQNIINTKNQLIVKYDWYDPNTKVATLDIGKPGTNLTAADIKFSTLGLGFLHHINDNIKVIFYYDIVKNETTQLSGYTGDLKDNIFTTRIHFRF
ncbi:MAG TPA: hypothetical protein VJ111_06740 [Chitinophagaceae bacterium]|nr:hypothetical protein [Chitinophagaceae bacterium]